MLSVIIVSYNSHNILESCINSVQKSISEKIKYEIIIINNQINEKISFSENINTTLIKIYNQEHNLGYSKAVNIGVEKTSGDIILLLNPDIEVLDDSIIKLYQFIKNNNNIDVVGAKIVDKNGKYKEYSRRRFPYAIQSISYFLKLHNFGLVNYYNYEDINRNVTQRVDSISGCCMTIRKNTFVGNKGFNENYFLYFEDTHFCWTVNKLNKSVYYFPEAEIIHYGGLSTETLPYLLKHYYFYKSLFIFVIFNIYEYKNFLINCILLIIIYLIFISNI